MGNIKLNYHLNHKTELNTMLTYRSKYALSDSNGNDILDTYDKFIDGYSLCDVGITHQISLTIFSNWSKEYFRIYKSRVYSNISGRLYYINFKINLNKIIITKTKTKTKMKTKTKLVVSICALTLIFTACKKDAVTPEPVLDCMELKME